LLTFKRPATTQTQTACKTQCYAVVTRAVKLFFKRPATTQTQTAGKTQCYAVVTRAVKLFRNKFEIISVFYLTCNHV